MTRRIIAAIFAISLLAGPAFACVGKSLLIGTDSTPESRVVAQLLAILINERTGTTVEIADFQGPEALFKEMSDGDADIGLDYAYRALRRAGKEPPAAPADALEEAKKLYMEKYNLVWMPPLGFSEPGAQASFGAPVAQKHALKKFPALPRLIAKTADLLPPETVKSIAQAPNMAKAAREFLKKNKLI